MSKKNDSTNIQELIKHIDRKSSFIITGAGITSASTNDFNRNLVGTWTSLLEYGIRFCCEKCGKKKSWGENSTKLIFQNQSSTDDLLQVGDEVVDTLIQKGKYEEWLKVFDHVKVENPQLIKGLKEWEIPIATVNYDNLIEDIFHFLPITPNDEEKIEKFLNPFEKKNFVLHLHGHFKQPKSIVLGKKSYERIVNDDFAQFINRYIVTFYKAIIFIGFGKGIYDKNFRLIFEWVRRHLKKTTMYHLVQNKDVLLTNLEHHKLGHKNVIVLGYGEKHEDLPLFVSNIASCIKHKDDALKTFDSKPICIGLERHKKINNIVEKIENNYTSPVSLMGTNGIGKTNLLLNIMHHPKLIRKYLLNRYFIRCEQAINFDLLLTSVITALEIQINPTDKDIVTQICNIVSHWKKKILIAFDNFETPWYSNPSGCQNFIAKLGKVADLIFSMRGETAPPELQWQTYKLKPLKENEAIKLFNLTSNNKFSKDPLIKPLLQELDFLPLPIKLIATRARSVNSLKFIYNEWEKRKINFLKIPGKEEQKNFNLLFSIQLSYESPVILKKDKQILKAISILPKGIEREHFLQIFDNSFDTIERLKLAALIEEDENDRIHLLSTIKLFLNEMPRSNKRLEEKVIDYYIEFSILNGRQVGKNGIGIKNIENEWSNISFILESYLNYLKTTKAILALITYVKFRGVEFEKLLLKAIENETDEIIKADLKKALGEIAFVRSNNVMAKGLFNEALSVYRKDMPSILGKANCTKWLGDIEWRTSNHEKAEYLYVEAIKFFKKANYPLGIAQCYKSLGDIELKRNYEKTENFYLQALPIFKETGYLLGEAGCIKGLGDIAMIKLGYDNARGYYEKALPMYEEVGSLLGSGNCIRRLGTISYEESKIDEADELYKRAIPLFEKVGDTLGIANCMCNLGDSEFQRAKYEKSKAFYLEAIPLYKEVGDVDGQAHCCYGIANIEKNKKKYIEAEQLYKDAILLLQRDNVFLLGKIYKSLGDLYKVLNKKELAKKNWCYAKQCWIKANSQNLIDLHGLNNLKCKE